MWVCHRQVVEGEIAPMRPIGLQRLGSGGRRVCRVQRSIIREHGSTRVGKQALVAGIDIPEPVRAIDDVVPAQRHAPGFGAGIQRQIGHHPGRVVQEGIGREAVESPVYEPGDGRDERPAFDPQGPILRGLEDVDLGAPIVVADPEDGMARADLALSLLPI